jgi:outer membrane autotransporter protein
MSSTFNQTLNGVALGADKNLEINGGQLTVGAAVLHDSSRLKGFDDMGSSSMMNGTSLMGYGVMDLDNGLFFSATLGAGHHKSKLKVIASDGSGTASGFSQKSLGGTGKAGYRAKVTEKITVTPFAKMDTHTISGVSQKLDNGMIVKSDRYWSTRGETGVDVNTMASIGSVIVKPYLTVAGGKEFVQNNEVKVNGIGLNNTVNTTGMRYGAGVDAQLTDRLSAGINVNYVNGKDMEQRWSVTSGINYSF